MSRSWIQPTEHGLLVVRPHRTRWEAAGAAVLLLVLLAIFFWPAVFGGRVLLPADLIYDLDPLWQPMAPEGYDGPTNHILSDQVSQFLPWRTFATRWLAQGSLPLWNPHVNGGQSFVGNAQSALFDPLQLPTYLLAMLYTSGTYAAPVIVAVLRLFVAGFFSYLFAREIGLRVPGALLTMIAFTFSGAMIGWVGYPLVSAIAWLPAMLWTVERALTTKRSLYVIACGLAVGAQFLGGHPETSFLVMLTWAAYAIFRAISLEGRPPSKLWPQLARIGAVAMIGIALAAVQLLPFVDALLQSGIVSARQVEAAHRSPSVLHRIAFEWHEWPTAITALLPQYFGTPLDESYSYPYSNYLEQNAYVGILPLALAVTMAVGGIVRRDSPRRRQVLFFAVLAVLCLGIAIRAPVLNIVNYLPLFRINANGRLRLVYAFGMAVLAGMGLDEICSDQWEYRRLTARVLAWMAVLSLILIALTYAGLLAFRGEIIGLGRAFIDSRWGTPYFSRPLEHYYALVEERHSRLIAQFLPSNIAMYLPVLVAVLWLLLRYVSQRIRLPARAWAYAALGVTMFDASLLGMRFNPTIDPQDVFPKPKAIEFLQQDSSIHRISGTDLILYPNSSMTFGLFDIRGYESVVPGRYVALIDRIQGHFRLRTNSLFSRVDSPLLDLLNVEYVLTDQELGGRWEQVYQDEGSVRVYRNREAMPRAFVVYRAEILSDAAESLDRITDPTFDFRNTVILEETPSGWDACAALPDRVPAVHVTTFEPNRVAAQVDTAADGLLVSTDSYMAGWRATVDGQKTRVYPANHAFRAVVVPAGVHTVEWTYRPVSFQVGVTLTILTLGALVLIPFVSRSRRR